jgi:hypothetical protein
LTAAPPDQTIELWGQDETRVGQQGRRPHGGAPQGTRPPVPSDTRYDNADVCGTCCPARDWAVGLIVPRAATALRQLPLAHLSAQLPAQVHAAISADGASWHRAPQLTTPPNLTLIPTPPYSPRGNPAAKPWQYLTDHFRSHLVCPTYTAILDACQHAWNAMTGEPGRSAALTAMQHLLCHDI